MVKYLTISVTACLALGLGVASAGDRGVVAEVVAAKVAVNVSGKQQLAKPRDARPGDVVEYRITYRNTSNDDAEGVIGTLAIPSNRLSYVQDSATPATVEASVDGKAYSPIPLLRLVVLEDGHMKMEPIPAEEYRFLRWRLGDLRAKDSTTVSVRMRIAPAQEIVVRNSAR